MSEQVKTWEVTMSDTLYRSLTPELKALFDTAKPNYKKSNQ